MAFVGVSNNRVHMGGDTAPVVGSHRQRLLYDNAAADVAASMLGFLHSHHKVQSKHGVCSLCNHQHADQLPNVKVLSNLPLLPHLVP